MPADRRPRRRALIDLAAGQGGWLTAAQARELGYSYQAQAYHVRAGNWLRVERGLFRLAEWPPDIHDDLIRWTLWSGGQGVVSHESALAVHGIGEFEAARVHLTVPVGFAKDNPALTLHHADLPPDDTTEQTGFSVTTPVRSLIDIAARAPDEDQIARAIQDASGAGMLTLRQLRTRAELVDARAALYIERAIQRMARP